MVNQLSFVLVIIQNIQYFLSFWGGFTAMKKASPCGLHELWLMLQTYEIIQDRVLRAKMQFFTKTRAGSILQRMGPDLVGQ